MMGTQIWGHRQDNSQGSRLFLYPIPVLNTSDVFASSRVLVFSVTLHPIPGSLANREMKGRRVMITKGS